MAVRQLSDGAPDGQSLGQSSVRQSEPLRRCADRATRRRRAGHLAGRHGVVHGGQHRPQGRGHRDHEHADRARGVEGLGVEARQPARWSDPARRCGSSARVELILETMSTEKMYRTLDDIEGRYVVVPPGEGVSLATSGRAAVFAAGSGLEDGAIRHRRPGLRIPGALQPAFSPADMRRCPMPMPGGAGAQGSRSPIWSGRSALRRSPEPGARTIARRSGFQTTRARFRGRRSTTGQDDRSEGQIRTFGARTTARHRTRLGRTGSTLPRTIPAAAALGAFRIPGLPEDATGWGLRERSPAGVDDIVPVLLASRWGREILAKVWKAIGGMPGGRRPDGPPASAPTGRKGYPLGSHNRAVAQPSRKTE